MQLRRRTFVCSMWLTRTLSTRSAKARRQTQNVLSVRLWMFRWNLPQRTYDSTFKKSKPHPLGYDNGSTSMHDAIQEGESAPCPAPVVSELPAVFHGHDIESVGQWDEQCERDHSPVPAPPNVPLAGVVPLPFACSDTPGASSSATILSPKQSPSTMLLFSLPSRKSIPMQTRSQYLWCCQLNSRPLASPTPARLVRVFSLPLSNLKCRRRLPIQLHWQNRHQCPGVYSCTTLHGLMRFFQLDGRRWAWNTGNFI